MVDPDMLESRISEGFTEGLDEQQERRKVSRMTLRSLTEETMGWNPFYQAFCVVEFHIVEGV